jgi:hypothetical protein
MKKSHLRIGLGVAVCSLVATVFAVRSYRGALLRASVCEYPGVTPIVLALGGGAPVDCEFTEALWCGTPKTIQSLLDAGYMPSNSEESDCLPMSRLARMCLNRPFNESKLLFEALLQRGADLNWGSRRGRAAIDDVSSPECVRYLLSKGAKIERHDPVTHSALQRVDEHPELLPTFVELLKEGANPNFVVEDGNTPLIVFQHPDFIKALLDYGADPNLQNLKGETALDRAYSRKQTEKAAVLEAHGAKTHLFESAADANSQRLRKEEKFILSRMGGSYNSGSECDFKATTPKGLFESSGGTWTASAGTEVQVNARCRSGRVLHWALLTDDEFILKGKNIGIFGNHAEFSITFKEPCTMAPLQFFVSDGTVDNLAEAVESKKATPAARITVSVGVVKN